ncbi:MAG TPA: hypothetical protein P5307_18565 [Pirellulaceae bacterium]|nr:hypothetical protein [Planctomycetales bacterium]MCB9939307.1 hypothetical protein [Planctomycetaceae bacterium]HRX81082.1 hypothetical protein [Pirellulaceae bacterium]
MDNPVIYQALGALLVLFFLFLTYMFTKTWRWFHVVCTFFVFGASIAFMCYATMSYKTHAAWRAIELKNRLNAEKAQAEFDMLMYGDRAEVVQTVASIRTQNAKFARMVFDRGRVWRGCNPQGPPAGDGSVTVSTVPQGAADPAAVDNQIEDKMVLYAFTEAEAPPEVGLPPGTKIPQFYLGEFTAVSVTNTSVTVRPTLPLDNQQRQRLQAGGQSWTLFETMPIDGHNFFATDPDAISNLNEDANVSPIFGKMDPDFLGKLLPPGVLPSYLRDGKRAEPTDPPEKTWVKVRFTSDHSEIVDSDATLGGVEGSQDWFDRGRSEIPLLQRGDVAKFKKGAIGVFPQSDADDLISRGVCERVEPIYVRSLNDYEYQFRSMHLQMVQIRQNIERLDRNIAEQTSTNGRTETLIAYRTEEKGKLQQDLDKFVYERDQVTAYLGKLQLAYNDTKAELSRLYRTNFQLSEELRTISEELTREINRRTAEAVAEVDAARRP